MATYDIAVINGTIWEAGNSVSGAYERLQFERTIRVPIKINWGITGWNVAPWPELRCLIDEAPYDDWMVGPAPYVVNLDPVRLPDGHHVMRLEWRWPEAPGNGLWCSNILFHTGAAIPLDQPQGVWAAPCKFDKAYRQLISDRPVKILWPGYQPQPKTRPLAPRTAEPYSTILPSSQLWVTRLGVCIGAGLARRFTLRDGGHLGTATYQQYHYADSRTHRVPLIDGPRGWGTMGHGGGGRVAPNGTLYWVATNGRIGWTGHTGTTLTLAGIRQKYGPGGKNALDPILAPQPSWLDWAPGRVQSGMEWFGEWKTPTETPMFLEPWDLAFWPEAPASPGHPLVLFTDTQPVTGNPTGLVAGRGRVCMLDHTPAHTGGQSHVWELWRHQVMDAQPWGIDRGPDGRYYVSCTMTHEIWALEIAVDGEEPNVRPRLVSAERVFQSALRPTLADLGLAARFDQKDGDPKLVRDRWNRDGAFGAASLIFPQSLRFLSDGTCLVACRYTFSIHRLDFRARTAQVFAVHPNAQPGFDYRDWTMDVNTDGTTGPKDLIRTVNWYMNTDMSWTPDGVARGGWIPKGRYLGGEDAAQQMPEGPADRMISAAYPWLVASGQGRVYFDGTGALQSCWVLTKRQATDPTVDIERYGRGRNVYRYKTVPSFTLSHGDEWQGQFGLPVPDEFIGVSDAEVASQIRAGLGTGIPQSISDADMADLLYFMKWNQVPAVQPPITKSLLGPTRILATVH